MPLTTPLSERLGIELPILAAPMFLVSGVDLVVASCEAGILGTIPSLNFRTPEAFRAGLEAIRSRTDRPFGVNVPLKLIDPARLEADLALCLEYEVPVIITSLGDPSAVVRAAHDRGLAVLHDATNLRHARKAEAAGVDAVIAVAAGAGGHAGRVSPFVLVPWLVEHLSCPVVAAGGVATGRQLAASLALGAQAVYVGTRFIAAEESAASPAYKAMCVRGDPDDVVYTDQVSGVHGNFLRRTIPAGGPVKDVKRWKDIWSAGQGIALADAVKPVAAIVADMVAEYEAARAALPPVGAS